MTILQITIFQTLIHIYIHFPTYINPFNHLLSPNTLPYSFSTNSNSLSKLGCRLLLMLVVPNGNCLYSFRLYAPYALALSLCRSLRHLSLQYFWLACLTMYILPHQAQASILLHLFGFIFILESFLF